MIKVILWIHIRLDESEIYHHYSENSAHVALRDLAQYGEEVWFHREMELPFLPEVGMLFEIALVDFSKDSPHHDYAQLAVEEVKWVEADGNVHITLVKDVISDIILPSEINQSKWTLGEGNSPWLKEKQRT